MTETTLVKKGERKTTPGEGLKLPKESSDAFLKCKEPPSNLCSGVGGKAQGSLPDRPRRTFNCRIMGKEVRDGPALAAKRTLGKDSGCRPRETKRGLKK